MTPDGGKTDHPVRGACLIIYFQRSVLRPQAASFRLRLAPVAPGRTRPAQCAYVHPRGRQRARAADVRAPVDVFSRETKANRFENVDEMTAAAVPPPPPPPPAAPRRRPVPR